MDLSSIIPFTQPHFPSLLLGPSLSGKALGSLFHCFFVLDVGWVGNSTACDTVSLEMELCVPHNVSSSPLSGLAGLPPLPCNWQVVSALSSHSPSGLSPLLRLSPHAGPHPGLILPPVRSSSLQCPLELSFHHPVLAFPPNLFSPSHQTCSVPLRWPLEPSQLWASWTILVACYLPSHGVLDSLLAVLAKSSKLTDSLSLSTSCHIFLPSCPLPTPFCSVLLKGLGRRQ